MEFRVRRYSCLENNGEMEADVLLDAVPGAFVQAVSERSRATRATRANAEASR
jgi:hypothetical protein